VPDPQSKGLDVVAEFQRSLRELDQAHCRALAYSTGWALSSLQIQGGRTQLSE
jgi:hypothetical protein